MGPAPSWCSGSPDRILPNYMCLHIESYLTTCVCKAAPMWCGLGCCSLNSHGLINPPLRAKTAWWAWGWLGWTDEQNGLDGGMCCADSGPAVYITILISALSGGHVTPLTQESAPSEVVLSHPSNCNFGQSPKPSLEMWSRYSSNTCKRPSELV